MAKIVAQVALIFLFTGLLVGSIMMKWATGWSIFAAVMIVLAFIG